MVQPMPYVAVQQLLDAANPKGMQNYWTADFLDDLPDEAVDVLVEHGHPAGVPADPDHLSSRAAAPSPASTTTPRPSASAAPRGTSTTCRCGPTRPTTSPNIAYTRELAAAMKPWSTGRAYLNFIGDEGAGRVEAAFGAEKFARLRSSSGVGPGEPLPPQPEHPARPRGTP